MLQWRFQPSSGESILHNKKYKVYNYLVYARQPLKNSYIRTVSGGGGGYFE